jgi:hypothetical protein
LAFSLSPTTFSTSPQLPSRAEIVSLRGVTGQLGFSQEAPCALRATVAGSSFRAAKNSPQAASTLEGSFS